MNARGATIMTFKTTKLIRICGAFVFLAASAGSSQAFLDTGSRPALTTIASTQEAAVPLPPSAQASSNVQSAELAPSSTPPSGTTTDATKTDSAATRISESLKNDDRQTIEKKIRSELKAFGIRF
jgi:hypothetical protein